MQVNITTKVNSQSIRRETYNGREHLVLPSYTLPANVVMNGGLYTAEEIDAHYQGLEGTLAPLGHPQVNGQFVSAFSPEGINAGHIGAWNRNVKKSGNRIYVEKWVDVARAEESEGGKELLERVAAIERGDDVPPIHTSVAAFLDQLEPNEQQRATGAEWVAKIHSMDHDAILLHEVGAATPEQGVGLMVNADLAKPLKANSGALVGESYREREQRLDRAAKAKFATGQDEYAWVADFTDSQAVIIRNGGNAEVFGYKSEGGVITFDDTGTAVARQESWVAVVANKFKSLFTPQEQPAPNHKTEGDMPLTTEEKQELISEIGKGLAANIADAMNPIKEAITGLQANQDKLTETLTANSRAEEKAKRDAVAKVHGEIVANALSGDALEAMYKTIGDAAPLGTNSAQQQKETGAPAASEYFK
ncbi:hypothetical protein EG929_15645 [Salmonella enterica]|uniref:Gp7 n=1 Tax=Salmonella enterica TaxID=28901 RepID=A0A722I8M8_SALER|nr:hypothetical protein [Salmonella enterica subsp. enterica serovar Give]EAM1085349.1 hypothetical protein [Salmonella enterica]EBW5438006.1 hypothetical protein [Salmonella enterica subsp. enterica serovar Amsterdam]EBZ8208696.1 hypothetical protein [Salmonella enterica subsp. enterica serovar Zanzibar]ECG5121542.1 hypothetical protein [Salmonella enterica subsp. enterica serovar London]ECH8034148.1 hypothetical protein [Salmonella enterica subsp. enterica]EDV4003664.1 hypothetical protein 